MALSGLWETGWLRSVQSFFGHSKRQCQYRSSCQILLPPSFSMLYWGGGRGGVGVGQSQRTTWSLFSSTMYSGSSCLYLLSHLTGHVLFFWYKFALCKADHPWTQVIFLTLNLSTRIIKVWTPYQVLRTLNSRGEMGNFNVLLGVYLWVCFFISFV